MLYFIVQYTRQLNKATYKEYYMTKKNDRIIYRRKDKKWVNKKIGNTRATSLHDTQKEADKAARINSKNQGGGEVITKGINGKIRSKDTISPANDPNPPIDKEH